MSGETKTLAARIADLHAKHPGWGATIIADALRCHDAYVRAVAKRHALKLPRSRYGAAPSAGAKYIREKRAAVRP